MSSPGLLIVLTSLLLVDNCGCCGGVDSSRAISYSLIKSDARSSTSVITRRRLADVAKCKDLAEIKQALAFNFERSPVGDYWEPNCILLHCPEVSGVRQLVNISGVDYYSSYSNKTYSGVTSEVRTRGLASLVGDNLVFVGLSKGTDRIWKNELGHPLSCFDYRAWDSGEPSHSRGCVGLVRASPKSDPVWRVVPCGAELPFVCEISHSQH